MLIKNFISCNKCYVALIICKCCEKLGESLMVLRAEANSLICCGRWIKAQLIGHDTLSSYGTDWLQFLRVQQVDSVREILNLCQRYSDVFSLRLNMMKGVQICINVVEGEKSIFHKARPVPYSIKDKTELELE